MLITSKDPPKYITPRLKLTHADFTPLYESTYYRVYEANSLTTKARHIIRVLDTESDFYLKNPDTATTLFIQELLYLCTKFGEQSGLAIGDFEVFEGKIAVVMEKDACLMLSDEQPTQIKQKQSLPRMIQDVMSDLTFLHSNLKLNELKLQLKQISFNAIRNTFYLNDWPGLLDISEERVGPLKSTTQVQPNLDENLKKDLYQLGFIALELCGIGREEWEDLPNIKGERAYNGALDGIMKLLDELKHPKETQTLIASMLHKDPAKRVLPKHLKQVVQDEAREEIKSDESVKVFSRGTPIQGSGSFDDFSFNNFR